MPALGMVIPQVDPATIVVPAAGTVAIVANLSGLLTVIKPDGSINPINPVNQTSDQSVSSATDGNINVGPGVGIHTVWATITGIPGTRTFSLVNVGLGANEAGWRLTVFFNLAGAPANVRLQVFNGNTLGTNLFDQTTDGIQQTAVGNFVWDGAQWAAVEAKYPAT